MLRWVWQILRAEGGLWLQLVQAKYLQGRPLLAYEHREGSQFWKSIQRIKHVIRNGLSVSIGNTEGTTQRGPSSGLTHGLAYLDGV